MKQRTRQKPVYRAPVEFTQPSNVDAEQSALGAMLIEAVAVDEVRQIVGRDDFQGERHRLVFDAITRLHDRLEAVDLTTVTSELRAMDALETVGGVSYIVVLYDRVPAAVNARHYANLVRFEAIRRNRIDAHLNGIQATLQAETPEELDRTLVESVSNLEGESVKRDGQSDEMCDLVMDVYEKASARSDGFEKEAGIATPFRRLNEMTGGCQPADLVVVAGRPSMGKTALAMEFGIDACLKGHHVAFFSLEMAKDLISTRLLSMIGEVQSNLIRGARPGEGGWDRLVNAAKIVRKMRWSVDAKSDHSPTSMAAQIREWNRKKGPVELIIIDYLQLIRADRASDNKNNEVGDIMRDLKAIAKENNAPIILLSQLSRAVEGRSEKKPVLSDLRDSGNIEQDADLVIFPYRAAYYQQFDDSARINIFEKQSVQLIVAKHRNGPTGCVDVGFVPAFTRFEEWGNIS